MHACLTSSSAILGLCLIVIIFCRIWKKSESVFVSKCKWIGLQIFIWQRWIFVNVLANTFYLDPSSELFFYSISFSLSMWFGSTKKVNDSWFPSSCHLILLCTFYFVTLPSSFNFFISIDTAGKRRWVLLPLWLIDLLRDSNQ